MRRHGQFAAIAAVCALAVLVLPMSAVSGSVSGTAQLSYGPGGSYYNASRNSVSAYEFDVSMTAAGLGLDNYQTYGYSVDVWQGIGSGSYPVELTALSDLGSDTYYEIAWLLDTYAGETGVSTDIEAMALQGLVWVTLTGDTSYYRPSSYWSYAARQQYNIYANGLASLTLDQATKDYLDAHYMVACNGTYQDLMVRLPKTTVVPAPASIALLGIGLSSLLVRRQRR